jgi:hypothetical protein
MACLIGCRKPLRETAAALAATTEGKFEGKQSSQGKLLKVKKAENPRYENAGFCFVALVT